ncbi:MAG: hypothetical protein HRU19_27065 [Pseudobacteriovorax sp.]|nr:hypothetical protein [Pseudobacteriovorax sp.]
MKKLGKNIVYLTLLAACSPQLADVEETEAPVSQDFQPESDLVADIQVVLSGGENPSWQATLTGCNSGLTERFETGSSVKLEKHDRNCLIKLDSLDVAGVILTAKEADLRRFGTNEIVSFHSESQPTHRREIIVAAQLNSPLLTSPKVAFQEHQFRSIILEDRSLLPTVSFSYGDGESIKEPLFLERVGADAVGSNSISFGVSLTCREKMSDGPDGDGLCFGMPLGAGRYAMVPSSVANQLSCSPTDPNGCLAVLDSYGEAIRSSALTYAAALQQRSANGGLWLSDLVVPLETETMEATLVVEYSGVLQYWNLRFL